MKQRILPTLFLCSLTGMLYAQSGKKSQAYAITGPQKGGGNWTEVRLVNIATGEEIQSVYKSGGETQVFNARTGKAIERKAAEQRTALSPGAPRGVAMLQPTLDVAPPPPPPPPPPAVKGKPVVRIDNVDIPEPAVARGAASCPTAVVEVNGNRTVIREGNRTVVMVRSTGGTVMDRSQPFATSSAACAYDAKHERLYYTPMGISELRYIDLKTGKIYFFEGESFGPLKSRHEVAKQITRMAIASDGNGYALTNDGNHLIRFSLEKKASKTEIADLGALTDDAVNGNYSIHSQGGFGGDMIADANKNLYLVTANRNVFRIGIENKVASFLGTIKNLPRGFTTNGAVVEEGSKVIVSSSNSTQGYFRFDLNTLEAEKVSSGSVYNASDLANGTLAFEKKKKKRDEVKPEAVQQVVNNDARNKPTALVTAETNSGSLLVYPNPVTAGLVKLNFTNQPKGQYQVQVLDLGGKLITQKNVTLGGKSQVEDLRIPGNIAAGTYLVRVTGIGNGVTLSSKILVE